MSKKRLVKPIVYGKNKKSKKPPIFYFFIIITSIALVILWFLLTFFKVRSIKVIGDNAYSSNQIIDQCGISMGKSVFEINMKEVERNIEKKFTMVESVLVKHKLFGTIEISIEKAKPVAVSQRSDKTYILLSNKLKILKMGLLIEPPDVALLEGIALIDPEEGKYAEFSKEESIKEEALKEIIFYLDKHELVGINKIDVSNYLDIILEYGSKIGIQLGTRSRMDMKIKDIKYLIDEKIPTGTSAFIDAALLESQIKPNIRYRIIGSIDEFYNGGNRVFYDEEESDLEEESEEESSDEESKKK